ncbi:MAG: sulfotransferase family protein [Chryseolinea sp.]
MIRINSISGPRNISTALMYSFAQREDTMVMDEPFYAFYLHETGIIHPGAEEVLKSQPVSENVVRQQIIDFLGKEVLFIKNMAHHMAIVDQSFVEEVTNVFLIRDPKKMLASYADVIHAPTLMDIGIAYQHELFNRLLKDGRHPVVIDSGLLLENPATVLKQLCQRLDLPFYKEMLHWQAGPKSYDGVWAPHWYKNVHRSTGFEQQTTSNRTLPARLSALNDEAQYYYQAMAPFSLQP